MKALTIAAFGIFSLAAFTANAASPTVNNIELLTDRSGAIVECEAEAVAFTEVADLANAFGSAGVVFAGALFELREQLVDCLVVWHEDEQDRSPHFRGRLSSFSDDDEQRGI